MFVQEGVAQVVLTLATSVCWEELLFYLEHLVVDARSSMPRKCVECLFYLFLMCLLVSLCVFLLTTPLRPLRSEESSEIEGGSRIGYRVRGEHD